MPTNFKHIAAIIHVPLVLILLYAAYVWFTYIDDVVTSGSKYGFTISDSKQQSFKNIQAFKKDYSDLRLQTGVGPQTSKQAALLPDDTTLEKIRKYDHWKVLLDGEGETSNIIRLDFDNDKLIQIYRYRKNFGLL